MDWTIVDVSGIEIPDDMQGRSMVPVLQGATPSDWRKTFYYHYYEFPGWHDVRRHYGVTDGRYKLIRFYEEDVDEWELYDLESDPNEMQSVYDTPEVANVQQKLMRELARLRKELDVPEKDPAASLGGGKDNPTSARIRDNRKGQSQRKPAK